MSGTLHLGTSGFAYDEWKGPFYPETLRAGEMLPFYASRFSSVEINYTFRRSPSEKALLSWRGQTPEGFVFSLKAHQRITHTLRLDDADEAVSFFLERVGRLGDRLGAILFQCPPSLKYDRRLIERFLGGLPPIRAAMEFRHPSWEEARGLLTDMGVAWCSAETDEKEPAELSWEPFGFLRLRKTAYTDAELKAWADRIGPALAAGHDVYCYFKHEDSGDAPAFALRLGELLGA